MARIRYSVGALRGSGLDRALRGIRTADPPLLLTGLALLLLRLYRSRRRAGSLIYRKRLSPGHTVTIRRPQSS